MSSMSPQPMRHSMQARLKLVGEERHAEPSARDLLDSRARSFPGACGDDGVVALWQDLSFVAFECIGDYGVIDGHAAPLPEGVYEKCIVGAIVVLVSFVRVEVVERPAEGRKRGKRFLRPISPRSRASSRT